MLDLVVNRGTLVDGTGRPRTGADVGVRDGRIVSLGESTESARRTIDATDLVVAPGFVDIHTHYDAQLTWDPAASPSTLHGVTTVVGGNCGFGIAPAGPDHADYIMRMMARVEGMPIDALREGLDWDWETFAQWFERFEGALVPNAAFLAGHSALRRVAMGAAAVDTQATDADVDTIRALLAGALEAGALGMSTSKGPAHLDGDGNPVPSNIADRSELLALAHLVGTFPGTTLQLTLPGCLTGFSDEEIDLMADLSIAAQRTLNWNLLTIDGIDAAARERQLGASDVASARGGRVVALVLPNPMRTWITFITGFGIHLLPGWQPVLELPLDERLRTLRDPVVRAELERGAASAPPPFDRLAQFDRLEVAETFAPENRDVAGRTVGEVAEARGGNPFETLLDIVVADDLRTGLRPPTRELDPTEWALKSEVWRDRRTIVGGSDAGAHIEMMCGAVYTTFLLGEAVRDHAALSLEEAVHQLTDVPARLYGLRDRGRAVVGAHADLVIFDPAEIGVGETTSRTDLPGGATRLYADARGIHHVLVNGTEIARDGTYTGAAPGTLLRSGRDTDTVTP